MCHRLGADAGFTRRAEMFPVALLDKIVGFALRHWQRGSGKILRLRFLRQMKNLHHKVALVAIEGLIRRMPGVTSRNGDLGEWRTRQSCRSVTARLLEFVEQTLEAVRTLVAEGKKILESEDRLESRKHRRMLVLRRVNLTCNHPWRGDHCGHTNTEAVERKYGCIGR